MKIFSELGFSLQVASVAAAEVGQVGQALAKAAEKTEEALSSEAGARVMVDGSGEKMAISSLTLAFKPFTFVKLE